MCNLKMKNVTVIQERLKSFEIVEENQYLTSRRTSKEVKRMLCDCTLTKEEIGRGELGCGEDCINRLLMIECGPRCQLGTRCTNSEKAIRENEVFNTEKKGVGLRALQDMDPGDFIIEYVGEVIDPQEFHRRAKDYAREKNEHYYFMALKSDAVIDATQQGNVSRFINHSCDPNAETRKWTVNGDLRVGLFARKSLKSGDEVTFDYQFQRYGKEAQRCYCESANCRGWIRENSERQPAKPKEKTKTSQPSVPFPPTVTTRSRSPPVVTIAPTLSLSGLHYQDSRKVYDRAMLCHSVPSSGGFSGGLSTGLTGLQGIPSMVGNASSYTAPSMMASSSSPASSNGEYARPSDMPGFSHPMPSYTPFPSSRPDAAAASKTQENVVSNRPLATVTPRENSATNQDRRERERQREKRKSEKDHESNRKITVQLPNESSSGRGVKVHTVSPLYASYPVMVDKICIKGNGSNSGGRKKRNNRGHGGSRRGSFSSEAGTPVPDRQAGGGTNSNITPAIEAIKSGVMNALQASKEFKVPKSTLYYQLKKLDIATPPYNITPAIEAFKSGVMNALQASKEYKVPKTTLYSKLKELDIASTSPCNITPAIEAVKSGVMNALQASKKYKVPQSTLYSKVKKQRQTKFRRMPSRSRVPPRSAQTM